MVQFDEQVITKEDHVFVKEDPARIYRGLKDVLVEEFDMDRVEEAHMEFNVQSPKDKIRLWAFKEKSPHTVLRFYLSFRAKDPRDVYKMERPEEILKARIKTTAWVVTVYPGQNDITWLPEPLTEEPKTTFDKTGLKAEHRSDFQKSKLYRVLVGIWYKKFYGKEIERYTEEAEEITVHLHNLMREKFGIEKTVHRSDSSYYDKPWE